MFEKNITKLFAAILITSSFSSQATVIVTNDWLSTALSASVSLNYEPSNISFFESASYAYQGAAIDLQNWVGVDYLLSYSGASASVGYATGRDVTGWCCHLQSALFTGYVTADDLGGEGVERHSAFLETNWTFTTTEDIEYEALMTSDEFPGPLSFSLLNNSTDEVVSEISGRRVFSNGFLEAFNTYTLTMLIDRTGPGGVDGGTGFYFALDDDLLLAANRTHHPVPGPSMFLLMATGLAGLGFASWRQSKKA